MISAVITIQNVKKSFKVQKEHIPILHIPSFYLEKGKQVALIGPSGSGKSTLLHLMSGILTPDQGDVIVHGVNLAAQSEKMRDRFRAQNIGYVFQDFHLINSLTAEENIKLMLPKMARSEQKELVEHWFQKVGLYEKRNHKPSELSRGQQQRVAIIRALIQSPPIVLADEPTGSLDFENATHIMNLLLTLAEEQNQTLLCVTHDPYQIEKFHEIIRMEEVNEIMNGRKIS